MKLEKMNKIMLLTAAASSLATAYHPVSAQETTQELLNEKNLLEEIIVTARKRSESLQDIPVAVSAVTSDDIEKRGIVALADLSDSTPGLVISDNFSGKTDRTVQTFTLRGFSPSSGADPTASMFIDGVPVSSTTAVSSVGSPERVEILRGPQSAYFGRNTFAGAINVVNKEPSKELSGSVAAALGNYEFNRLRGEIEGELINDKLSIRASVERYEKEGAWDNEGPDGGTLGDQKTTMGNLYLLATPTENLTIKTFAFISEDRDGPAASGFVSAYDITDFFGNVVVQGQSNCDINGNPYFCGSVPTKVDPISYNTEANDDIKTLLQNSDGRLSDTSLLNDYGMARDFNHAHVVADWNIGDSDFTLSSLTGYNHEQWILLNDIDHYGADFFNYGFLVERETKDFSQEFRISYVNDGPVSATFGLSYLDAEINASQTGLISFFPTPAAITPYSTSTAETLGAFFGVNYEFNDVFTLSLEGRLQEDEIASIDSSGEEIAKESFTNFLPRIIVDYHINDDLMGYVTYSKGVNPAAFNTRLLSQSQFVQDEAAAIGLTLTVEPEEVDNFELGLKGSAFDGNMTFAAAAYYAIWSEQINRNNLVVVEPGATMATSFSGVSNSGEVDLFGLEFESNWFLSDNLRLNTTLAYTDSDIKKHTNALLTGLSGISDFSGKEQPFVSKYSGNMGLQYDGVVASEYDYFARVDYVYKSGQWINQANFVKTEDIHKVNLRAGITIGNLDLQGYVKNLFDDDSYTSGADYFAFQYDFAYFGVNSGMIMGLAQPRTYGLEAKWSFY